MINLNKLYFGIVEDYENDPTRSGKAYVRIIGIHTDNKKLLPTNKLPLCNYLTSNNNPYVGGIGISPSFFLNGSMVALVPIDDALQEWLIVGQLPRSDYEYINNEYGFNSNGSVANPIAATNVLAGGNVIDYKSSNMYQIKSGNLDNDNVVYDNPVKEEIVPKNIPELLAKYMELSYTQVGINENSNADVVSSYLKYASLSGNVSSVKWCSAFVCAMLERTGIKSTRSGMSRSYLNYGVASEPIFGSIAVFQSKSNPSFGHVGFCIKNNDITIQILGGNQSSKSHSNGGEVSITNIPKSGSLILLDTRLPNS